MKFRKALGLFLILSLLAAIAVGCAKSAINQSAEQPPPSQSEKILPPDTVKVTATYTGRIDSNSVEMCLPRRPQAFQLTDELMETWDSMNLKEGDQLEIQYQMRKDDRPLLINVKKK